MNVFIKRLFLSVISILLLTQVFFLPKVHAVDPWRGESWEGTPWEGTPWDASDFYWEGTPWEGSPWQAESWVGDPIDSEGNSDSPDPLCLPSPTQEDDCDDTGTMDLSTSDKIDEAVDQFIKDNPYLLLPDSPFYKEERKEQIERIRQDFERLASRPNGTLSDVTIPDNVLATIANTGYSDGKLGDTAVENNNEYLAQYGWMEIHNDHNSDTGFHARTFENSSDKSIVISFAGTEEIWKDGKADAAIALGYDTKQYEDSISYVEEMMELYPDHQIVLTGHSLGGGLAQHVAVNLNVPAVTWNAPGIETRSYSFLENPLRIIWGDGNLEPVAKYFNENGLFNNLIANHMMEDDEIATYQIHAGKSYMYSGDGTTVKRDDYGEEAHRNDTLFNKVLNLYRNWRSDFSSHGINNFIDLMALC